MVRSMNRKKRVPALLTAALMVLGMAVVAAPSASAADCAVDQTPVLSLVSSTGAVKYIGSNPYVEVSATVSVTCGSVSGTSPYFSAKNDTTGVGGFSGYMAKISDDGKSAVVSGVASIPNYVDQFGKFSVPYMVIYYGRTLATSSTFAETYANRTPAFYNRYVPYLSDPDPATQTVLAGQNVVLTGYFGDYPAQALKKTEKIELQTQNASGGWDTVQTTDVDPDKGSFRFTYKPTKSVIYRYHYVQTDWAAEESSLQAVINYIPETVVNKPPAMPAAFISATTSNSISLNWDTPSPTNGTITAYRFGWTTPSGKPVPSWEGTYPTTSAVPDPFTFTNLIPDTDYTVWIEAVNGTTADNISARNSITVRTKAAVTPPPTSPPPTSPPPTSPPPTTPPVVTPPPTTPPPAAPPVVIPTPQVSVYAAAVSRGGKLYVDVNPNRTGKGYYKFRVQKWNGATWVNKKVYKTAGKKETRTINLPKGSYRVVVASKYGLLGNVSESVYLRK